MEGIYTPNCRRSAVPCAPRISKSEQKTNFIALQFLVICRPMPRPQFMLDHTCIYDFSARIVRQRRLFPFFVLRAYPVIYCSFNFLSTQFYRQFAYPPFMKMSFIRRLKRFFLYNFPLMFSPPHLPFLIKQFPLELRGVKTARILVRATAGRVISGELFLKVLHPLIVSPK